MQREHSIINGTRKIITTVLTQFLILVLSVVTGFILPVKMGPEAYGYFQVYVFYLAYINLAGLGYNDGLNLFYAGYEYTKLPFARLRSAIRFFCGYLAVLTVIVFIGMRVVDDWQYRQIYQILAVNIPLVCLQCVLLSLFLSVNHTGIYNIINLLTKVLSTAFILALVIFGIIFPTYIMLADTLSKMIMLIICIFLARRLFIGKGAGYRLGVAEFSEKSKAGIKLTLAIIASSFIPVAGRIIIQWNESIEVYGMYSFAITLLMIIISFTSAAGTVVFPLIKRLSADKLTAYYPNISLLCDTLIYLAFLVYIPLVFIIQTYMVQYIPVLQYLYILMAMCLPLGRMQLLITPYYKLMRMEKSFLLANGIGMAIMLVVTAITYWLFQSVVAVAWCTTIVLFLWTVFTELYLVRQLKYSYNLKRPLIEFSMMLAFIIAGCFKSIIWFTGIYVCVLIIYLFISRKQIKELLFHLSIGNYQA